MEARSVAKIRDPERKKAKLKKKDLEIWTAHFR